MRLSRRDLFKLGSAAGIAGVAGLPRTLAAKKLGAGGRGFSHATELGILASQAVPLA